MVGSMQSIAQVNYVLNTIVAESLCLFADRLEKSGGSKSEIGAIILETIKAHKRVIFNGNNYSEEWLAEAGKRGLPNIRNTVDAIAVIREKKNIAVMAKHGVLSKVEMESRSEIQYEIYIKTINIEAQTMVEMAKRQILPAVIAYKAELAGSIGSILAVDAEADVEKALLTSIGKNLESFNANLVKLEKAIEKAAHMHGNAKAQAVAYRDIVFTAMAELRQDADILETLVDGDYWPMPTYAKLLFSV